jgi:hypothetical protein
MPRYTDLAMEGRVRLLKVLNMATSPEFIVDILRSVSTAFIYKFLRDDAHLSLGLRLLVFWFICLVYYHANKWIRRRYLTGGTVSHHERSKLN